MPAFGAAAPAFSIPPGDGSPSAIAAAPASLADGANTAMRYLGARGGTRFSAPRIFPSSARARARSHLLSHAAHTPSMPPSTSHSIVRAAPAPACAPAAA